jgi:hypothetical protein
MKNFGGTWLYFILLFLTVQSIEAQDFYNVFGKVTDLNRNPLFLVNVATKGEKYGTVTNEDGTYQLNLPPGKEFTLVYSSIGYKKIEMQVIGTAGETRKIDVALEFESKDIQEVAVTSRHDKASNLVRIDIRSIDLLPNTTGGVETIIKTLPGVASNNELSSQYSVRGGNFDENLVYINDIEVYRPLLIRSGQQEGMSIINPDLVSSLKFSAGGFEAEYGDKMSSVLDITYKKPTENSGSFSIGMLGATAHYEGIGLNGRFSHISGFRYKTTQYLLNSLDTRGDYKPTFGDFQTYMTYDVTPDFEISFLGNIARNSFRFVPTDRETEFGTYDNPLELKIFYDGGELDEFNTYFGATSFKYNPVPGLNLKLDVSAYNTVEAETFDIQGQYLLNQLDNDPKSETRKDSLLNIGIGTLINHARNYMDAYVLSVGHKGKFKWGNNQFKWGINHQFESIDDKISEWEMVDSSGYSIPYSSSNVLLNDVMNGNNTINSTRTTGYLQDTYTLVRDSNEYYFTGGARANYWSFSEQFLVSPRAAISISPNWEKDFLFQFSTGIYYQPPFYKEMRYPDGTINKDIKAQRSIHFLVSSDYLFQAWDRPFKFTSEIYYKHMNNLIPYKVENVRLRYAGENLAKGYAMGLDMKLNGEFVKGIESWASLSIMSTKEDIKNDSYVDDDGNIVEPGYYPRPTDQLINFGLFFQDYFPNNPSYKVHLNLLYGGKLPVSFPVEERYDKFFRMRAYKRVDIGFSKMLIDPDKNYTSRPFLAAFKSAWISAEIFNLLGIENTISYLWVKTVSNQSNIAGQFAVPNFLTGRRFNLKMSVKF